MQAQCAEGVVTLMRLSHQVASKGHNLLLVLVQFCSVLRFHGHDSLPPEGSQPGARFTASFLVTPVDQPGADSVEEDVEGPAQFLNLLQKMWESTSSGSEKLECFTTI